MTETRQLYVFLIKVKSPSLLRSRDLVRWIDDIEKEYMGKFGDIGSSVAHVELQGAPWDFALVFPGSEASVRFLTDRIDARAPGETECLAMRGRDLDELRKGARQ